MLPIFVSIFFYGYISLAVVVFGQGEAVPVARGLPIWKNKKKTYDKK